MQTVIDMPLNIKLSLYMTTIYLLKIPKALTLIWAKERIVPIQLFKYGGILPVKIKFFKAIFISFIITNMCLIIINSMTFIYEVSFSATWWVNFMVLGGAAFSERKFAVIIPISFWIIEIILTIALFIKTCKFKLIANIIFCILCVIDMGTCIFLLTKDVNCIVEIILDLIFILLILFDIIQSYKKPQHKTQGNDSSVCE